ncbi:hypothetical protein RB10866 [Rhodopirellula baltica SH 1]|uniref:Uncharacterized protein n=1 Tax=Rhodopirellula baltica (strain DSM 10527 / NCIMB 13988 / SH1) TaxID=243090 RepID=Q7UK48_RHOBA|nr:hypothetical protein RB10866 [Rhodopirellula baltica SH 1]
MYPGLYDPHFKIFPFNGNQGVEGAVHHPFTFAGRHRCTRPNHVAASCRCWTQKSTSGRRIDAPVQHLGQFTPLPFDPPLLSV